MSFTNKVFAICLSAVAFSSIGFVSNANASIFGIVTGLVGGESTSEEEEFIPLEPTPPGPVALTINPYAGYRTMKMVIESSDGDRKDVYIGYKAHRWGFHGNCTKIHGDSDWYAVTIYAVKWKNDRPVGLSKAKDFRVFYPGAHIGVVKVGHGDWLLYGSYLR